MDDLYGDLCAAMPKLNHDIYRDDRYGNPVVVFILLMALKAWITYQLRKHTCERKEEIIAATRRWIAENIRLERVAARLTRMSERVIRAVCF